MVLHLAFSVPSMSETVLGARGVGLRKTGTLSCMDSHSTRKKHHIPECVVHRVTVGMLYCGREGVVNSLSWIDSCKSPLREAATTQVLV